jgi:hypothetical protein
MSIQIRSIVGWIKDTPGVYQEEIIDIICSEGGGRLIHITPNQLPSTEEFIKYMESQDNNSFENINSVLALRDLIDSIINVRLTPEFWANIRRDAESSISRDETAQDKKMISIHNEILDDLPQQEEDWKEIYNRWSNIRNRELSDKEIEKWKRNIPILTPRPHS